MTARIVNHLTRERTNRELWDETPHNGDTAAVLGVPPAPGQLWERVAQLGQAGVVNLPQYTPRIADAARHRFDARANRDARAIKLGLCTTRYSGPLASSNPLGQSGIIRAGVRVR